MALQDGEAKTGFLETKPGRVTFLYRGFPLKEATLYFLLVGFCLTLFMLLTRSVGCLPL
jgi:hypothetical protein